MPIPAGARLGPYEVVSPLGAGGMGEVYRARDTRLGREVALKVLSPAIASDPDHLRRFEQEARAASALSDSHIVSIFDVGEEGGVHYFASELVEGGDLRQRLGDTLSLKKTLEIAGQIASGLAAAHEKGIIHRDLKPENILLTKAGQAKIADFGLAKLAESSEAALSQMPTADRVETTAGMVMGTVSYMSPEQASGRKVDYRSDQFSFGSILYEMLTGHLAFRKQTKGETLAAILRDDPLPVSESNAEVPAPVAWIVERCLVKDPQERYASTRDLARDLALAREHASHPTSSAQRIAKPARGKAWRERLSWIAGGFAAAIAVAAVWSAGLFRPEARPLRLSLSLPDILSRDTSIGNFAIAPDGRTVVYVVGPDNGTSLSLVTLATGARRPITGTEGASYPFWSPDSRSIGFFADGKLKRVAAAGGAPQVICGAPAGRGGSWSIRDEILFEPRYDQPLALVSAAGGAPRFVTRLDGSRHEENHKWPCFLPDGRRFVYLAGTSDGGALFGASLDGGERKLIVETTSSVIFVAPHWLLYATPERTLVARRLDPSTFAVRGTPIPLAERVQVYPVRWNTEFSASATGILLYEGRGPLLTRLAILDETGRELRSIGRPRAFDVVRVSPAGDRACLEASDERTWTEHFWMADLARGTMDRFTSSEHEDQIPVWSPDGRLIYFNRHVGKSADLYVKDADGSTPERLVFSSPDEKVAFDVTRDGRRLLITRRDATTGSDLWAISTTGDPDPRPILRTAANEGVARLSPDNRWFAYQSDESGEFEVYVRPFPSGPGKWKVSSGGGTVPFWQSDGRRLFFSSPKKIMAVDVNPGPGFSAGIPREVLQEEGDVDVLPGGKSFAVLRKVEEGPGAIEAVVNWTALLEK